MSGPQRIASFAFALVVLGGCSCGSHEEAHETPSPTHEGESEGAQEATEAPAPAVHPIGPLGWTAVVESEGDDGEYTEHRLLVWRTGPATGERPATLEEMGHFSNWAGDYTLYEVGQEAGERPLSLFGVRGACEATASRLVHLRVHFEPHHGDDEDRLYDALEFDGCSGAYAFGAEGSVELTELSTRTMETPPPEIAAVVHDREQQITDESGDEPMRLVGRRIEPLDVWVLSGWETYVVRGTTIVTHTEDNVIGALTIGDRTMLLLRGDDGAELDIPGEHDLTHVNPDTDPAAP
jgi:hypothetical protein